LAVPLHNTPGELAIGSSVGIPHMHSTAHMVEQLVVKLALDCCSCFPFVFIWDAAGTGGAGPPHNFLRCFYDFRMPTDHSLKADDSRISLKISSCSREPQVQTFGPFVLVEGYSRCSPELLAVMRSPRLGQAPHHPLNFERSANLVNESSRVVDTNVLQHLQEMSFARRRLLTQQLLSMLDVPSDVLAGHAVAYGPLVFKHLASHQRPPGNCICGPCQVPRVTKNSADTRILVAARVCFPVRGAERAPCAPFTAVINSTD
jgi:hypothetical protein